MAARKNAYDLIKQMIFDDEIPEGTLLVERELAEGIGVSRIPVREALQRLAVEGIIVHESGRGLVSRAYSFQDIAELYLYREALDGMAARLFALRGDDSEFEYLGLVFSAMEENMDRKYSDYWVHKDMEFHGVIAKGCRNDRITRLLENVYEECFLIRGRYLAQTMQMLTDVEKQQIAEEVLLEHKEIFDALVSRDPDDSEEAARASDRAAHSRMIRRYARHNLRVAVAGDAEMEKASSGEV